MKPAIAAALLILTLAGCTAAPPRPAPSEAPPTSTPDESGVVDPGTLPTALTINGAPATGIDFQSADGNVQCGIFEGFAPYLQNGSVPATWVGCRPIEVDEPFVPSATSQECFGFYVADANPALSICTEPGTAVLAGDSPELLPGIGTPPVESTVSYLGVTCEALTDSKITCTVDATGYGFITGRSLQETFPEGEN